MIGEAEKAGLIDPTSNLKDAPAMVFYGTNDKVVDPETTKLQADIYNKYGANVSVTESTYAHVWPIDREPTDAYPKVSCED